MLSKEDDSIPFNIEVDWDKFLKFLRINVDIEFLKLFMILKVSSDEPSSTYIISKLWLYSFCKILILFLFP